MVLLFFQTSQSDFKIKDLNLMLVIINSLNLQKGETLFQVKLKYYMLHLVENL